MKAPRQKVQGTCKHCQQPFEYEQKTVVWQGKQKRVRRRVTRQVCDRCEQGRKKWLDKKRHARAGSRSLKVKALPRRRDRNQVAKSMGLTPGQLDGLELSALTKLRNSPELRAAYDNFKGDGMPLLDQLVAALRLPKADRLLEHQLELVEFYQVYGDARAAGLSGEARAVLDEIARCHGMITRELKR